MDKKEDHFSGVFTSEENETFERIKTDINAFADYERLFQEVLLALENDEVLEDFRSEYAGLHHSFLKSHEGESRLLRKCLDLQADIFSCVAKAQTAEELAEGDKNTITQLRSEIDKTSKKCTTTREKEAALKEKILKLKREVAELEAAAKEPVEAAAQEAALQSLHRVHETVLKEREIQEFQVTTMLHDIAFMERRIEKLKEAKSGNDAELRALRDAIDAKQQEVDGVMARKAEKEAQLRAVRRDMVARNVTIAETQKQVQDLQDTHAAHREEIRQLTEETAALSEEYQILCRQIQHSNVALQTCNEDNDTLQRRTRETTQELQLQQSTVSGTSKQCVREGKVLEALRKRNAVALARRLESEQARDATKLTIEQKERELAEAVAAVAAENKALALVHRERDVLHQEHLTAEQQAQRNAVWLAEKATQLHHAEHELGAFEEHVQTQNESLFHITKETLAYEKEAKNCALQCATVLTEAQARDRQIADSLRSCADVEQRLKQQRALLESVTNDRDAYTKHYGQLRNELTEMNKKFNLALLQIQQMKDEILRREREASQEDAALAALQRQRKDIEGVIITFQRRAEKKDRLVEQFKEETGKLTEVVGEAAAEVTRQRQRCREVTHERDLLHTRAVQRTKELTALCEKIYAQQALLKRSEALYRERVAHMEELEFQCAALTQQVSELSAFVARLPELRVAINTLSRELIKEQVRVRALTDEAAQPLNLHENHTLAWTEPDTFALLQRAQKLQSQLTVRRQRLEATEHDIAVMEQRYLKARTAVARQPGPEVAEQLSAYQAALVKKRNQLRDMQDSLFYFREQTELYRGRHDELRARLAEMAKQYAAERSAEDRQRRREERQRQERSGTKKNNNNNKKSGAGQSGSDDDEDSDGDEEEEDVVYEGFVAPPLEIEPSMNDNNNNNNNNIREEPYSKTHNITTTTTVTTTTITHPPTNEEEEEEEEKEEENQHQTSTGEGEGLEEDTTDLNNNNNNNNDNSDDKYSHRGGDGGSIDYSSEVPR